jgi:hypothetical protein
MTNEDLAPISSAELAAEGATQLPSKEVMSLLDLNLNLDAALDLAAPIDLAVAANANVAAPIDAAVSANVLSAGSHALGLAHQDAAIDQGISGQAVANSGQHSALDQGSHAVPGTVTPAPAPTAVTAPTPESALNGDLLKVDVNAALDAHVAAPIAGAVAANANVAAPIDASVSANVLSVDSTSTALADQHAVVAQHLDGVTAAANTDQQSDITQ